MKYDTVTDEIDDILLVCLTLVIPEWMDYYFLPLIFLESFYAPAICLQIGEHNIPNVLWIGVLQLQMRI